MDEENVLESFNMNSTTGSVPASVAGKEECCDIPWPMICGPILSLYFILVGIIGFGISAGLYNSSKEEGFSYEGPDATVIAFHWMCVIGGIGVGVSIFFCAISPVIGIWIGVISGGILLIFYILYIIWFTLSAQYKLSSDAVLINLADLQAQWNNSLETCPYIGVYGSALYWKASRSGGKRYHLSCTTNELRMIPDDDCQDKTELIKAIADVEEIPKTGYKVYTNVAYTFADVAYCNEGISRAKADGMGCLEQMSGLDTLEMRVTSGISDLSPAVLVTNDGKLPSFVSKARALSAVIFFAGVLYSYEVSKIPVLRQEFTKTNVNVTYVRPTDACAVMGSCK